MAERTEGSIVIKADPAAIMADITDFENYTEWSNEIKKTEVLDRDTSKRGKRVAFVVEAPVVGKSEYTLDYTYTPNDTGCSWDWVEGKGAVKHMSGEYVLEPAGAGQTKVTYRLEMEIGVRIPGFLKRQGQKMVTDVALKGLKKRIEEAS